MSSNRHSLSRRGTATRTACALAIAISMSHCSLWSGGPFVALSASQQKIRDRGEAVEFEGADLMLRLDDIRDKVCIDPGQRDAAPSIFCLRKDGWERRDKPDSGEVYCCKKPLAWRVRYHSADAPRAFQGVMYELGTETPQDPFYFSVYVPKSESPPAPVAQGCPPATATELAKGAP